VQQIPSLRGIPLRFIPRREGTVVTLQPELNLQTICCTTVH